MNQVHDYSQNYAPASSQSGYNANGYSQYSQQSYPQPSEYDQNQGYSQDYKYVVRFCKINQIQI